MITDDIPTEIVAGLGNRQTSTRIKPAEINSRLAEHVEAFVAMMGATKNDNGWTIQIGEDEALVHGGFQRGQWTYLGETGDDLVGLYAAAKGILHKEAQAACLMWLAEQGVEIEEEPHELPARIETVRTELQTSRIMAENGPAEEPLQRETAQHVTHFGSERPAPAHRNGSNPHGSGFHRLLPQSEDAEKGVLGSFLIDPDTVARICEERRVKARHFHIPSHAMIFGELLFMVEHRMQIDIVTLTEHLRGARLLAARAEGLGLPVEFDLSAHFVFLVFWFRVSGITPSTRNRTRLPPFRQRLFHRNTPKIAPLVSVVSNVL